LNILDDDVLKKDDPKKEDGGLFGSI